MLTLKSFIKRGACAAILGLLPLSLAGCFYEDYVVRRDLISHDAGDANASNKAIQTIDPWPAYAKNTTLTTDGQRAAAAADNYRQNKVQNQSATASASTLANISTTSGSTK